MQIQRAWKYPGPNVFPLVKRPNRAVVLLSLSSCAGLRSWLGLTPFTKHMPLIVSSPAHLMLNIWFSSSLVIRFDAQSHVSLHLLIVGSNIGIWCREAPRKLVFGAKMEIPSNSLITRFVIAGDGRLDFNLPKLPWLMILKSTWTLWQATEDILSSPKTEIHETNVCTSAARNRIPNGGNIAKHYLPTLVNLHTSSFLNSDAFTLLAPGENNSAWPRASVSWRNFNPYHGVWPSKLVFRDRSSLLYLHSWSEYLNHLTLPNIDQIADGTKVPAIRNDFVQTCFFLTKIPRMFGFSNSLAFMGYSTADKLVALHGWYRFDLSTRRRIRNHVITMWTAHVILWQLISKPFRGAIGQSEWFISVIEFGDNYDWQYALWSWKSHQAKHGLITKDETILRTMNSFHFSSTMQLRTRYLPVSAYLLPFSAPFADAVMFRPDWKWYGRLRLQLPYLMQSITLPTWAMV